jgi:hypothetical protein
MALLRSAPVEAATYTLPITGVVYAADGDFGPGGLGLLTSYPYDHIAGTFTFENFNTDSFTEISTAEKLEHDFAQSKASFTFSVTHAGTTYSFASTPGIDHPGTINNRIVNLHTLPPIFAGSTLLMEADDPTANTALSFEIDGGSTTLLTSLASLRESTNAIAALVAAVGTDGHFATSGGNIRFRVDIVGPTPIPETLPLFASALGALGILGSRHKRRATRA